MRRLSAFDTTLLVLVGAAWAICFALSLRVASRPASIPMVFIEAAPDGVGYPTISGFAPQWAEEDRSVEVGERLLRLSSSDLQGVGQLEFFVRFIEQIASATDGVGSGSEIMIVVESDGVSREVAVPAFSLSLTRWVLPFTSLVFVAVSFALLLFASPTSLVRAFFLAFMTVAVYFCANVFGSRVETYIGLTAHIVSMTFLGPLIIRAFLRLPLGKVPSSRAAKYVPWGFAILGPVHMTRYGFFGWSEAGSLLSSLGFLLLLLVLLAAMTRRFRSADPVGRRQIKWAVLGLYVGLAPPILGAVLVSLDPVHIGSYVLFPVAGVLLPLAVLVSLVRVNLLDIDRVLSTLASYNLLLILGVGLGLVIVPRAGNSAAAILGIQPVLAEVGLSLAGIAVLVIAGQRLVRPAIERAFFSQRYAFDQGVDRLVDELSSCDDSQNLTERAGEGLVSLVEPESCSVYALERGRFAPVFAPGGLVPPSFDSDGPLVATLRSTPGG